MKVDTTRIISLMLLWLQCCATSAFQNYNQQTRATAAASTGARTGTSTKIFLSRPKSKWDDIVDDDDDDEDGLFKKIQQNTPRDMRYNERNVRKQNQNFAAIREAGGKDLTNDVYIQEPDNSDVFWFVGKVARVSDVTLEQCVARQYPLIEQHGASLRPIELFPHRGELEIWIAPGDSELEVAYNRPDIVFTKMRRKADGSDAIKASMVGFQGEVYDKAQAGMGGGMGFRTWRTKDGRAAKPEIQAGVQDGVGADDNDEEYSDPKYGVPTAEDLEELQKALKEKNMDITDFYEQQQKQKGIIE